MVLAVIMNKTLSEYMTASVEKSIAGTSNWAMLTSKTLLWFRLHSPVVCHTFWLAGFITSHGIITPAAIGKNQTNMFWKEKRRDCTIWEWV